MMSPRYAAGVAALLLLTLVPTVVHTYLGLRRDDGIDAAQIADGLKAPWTAADARSADWAGRRLDAADWVERTYTLAGGHTARLSIARGFDAKTLYHHPELAVTYGIDFLTQQTVELSGMPDVPVHVLRRRADSGPQMALYVVHYDQEFIENPLTFQLRLAAELLVFGRRPTTLIFVLGDDAGGDAIERSAAADLLRGAVDSLKALTSQASS